MYADTPRSFADSCITFVFFVLFVVKTVFLCVQLTLRLVPRLRDDLCGKKAVSRLKLGMELTNFFPVAAMALSSTF